MSARTEERRLATNMRIVPWWVPSVLVACSQGLGPEVGDGLGSDTGRSGRTDVSGDEPDRRVANDGGSPDLAGAGPDAGEATGAPDGGEADATSTDAGSGLCTESTPEVTVTGPRIAWQTITLDFFGPTASESGSEPNPFLDVRFELSVEAPDGTSFAIPGAFAGDGVGGSAGPVYRVRLRPDHSGSYGYQVSCRRGPGVAVAEDGSIGEACASDGLEGRLCVGPPDLGAPGFLGRGPLEWDGGHYLATMDGQPWMKTGADSPENFLGYAGFDGTRDLSGGTNSAGLRDGVHRYAPHVSDWRSGDPDWGDGAGRGIIGALNYLASEGVNSVYFLPCNIGGDGRDTWPYVEPDDLRHFDVSKLEQWEVVFSHAQRLGIALHFVLSETESGNENLHDDGQLGVERQLFYRELVARFAHHPAVFWNLGEENDYGAERQKQFAGHLAKLDPYDHPTTVHTHKDQVARQYDDLVGDPHFDLTSIQLSPHRAGEYVETWRARSRDAGRPWAVMLDEIGPAGTGVTDANADDIRRLTLWPALMSGGAGVEWYFGYHALPLGGDIRTEDFRTRSDIWRFSRLAREFFEAHLPFTEMEPDDDLASGGAGSVEVFRKACDVIAIYVDRDPESVRLDLSGAPGARYRARWFDPRFGTVADGGTVDAGDVVGPGAPPGDASSDWVWWLEAAQTPSSCDLSGSGAGGSGGGGLEITALVLVDAESDLDVRPLAPRDTIRRSELPSSSFNVRADVTSGVRSVRFRLDGAIHRTESVAPFALEGDEAGDYRPWTPPVGRLLLEATPFSDVHAGGAAGSSRTLDLTIEP